MMTDLTPDRLQELRRIAEAWLQVNHGLKDYIPIFDPTTVLELLDTLAAARAEAEALRKRIEELEAVLRLVYDEFVLDVARWCRHCRLRIDDHAPECPMAEVERVLGLAGGATDA